MSEPDIGEHSEATSISVDYKDDVFNDVQVWVQPLLQKGPRPLEMWSPCLSAA